MSPRGLCAWSVRGRRPLSTAAFGLALALWAAAGASPAVKAQEAPADSSLHQFLRGLTDSTDAYFGMITAPVDTAGFDSALVAGLEAPWRGERTRSPQ